jgi:ABC-type dipeptide/oligopeptide/nickel transport system ATPase subunit
LNVESLDGRELLSIQNLRIQYFNQKELLYIASLNVQFGEILGIYGESGSGKSSLLKTLAGFRPNDEPSVKGVINFKLSENTLKTAFIFQHSERTLNPIRRIRNQLTDILPGRTRETWLSTMRSYGIIHPEQVIDQYPYQNSGGENQRVAWMMSMENEFHILLADEPVANVDHELKKLFGILLKKKVMAESCSAILVSHDRHFLNSLCNRVLELKDGNLIASEITDEPEAEAVSKDFEQGSLLSIEGLSFGFNEDRLLFDNLSIRIPKGALIGLFGNSGEGKSTLLKIIAGEILAKGKIQWNTSEKYNANRVDQNAYDEFSPIYTIGYQLREYIKQFGKNESEIYNWMNLFHLDPSKLLQKRSELSGGQIQRFALIKSLIIGSQLILLDESFSGLDDQNIESMMRPLREICFSSAVSIILVMHRTDLLNKYCDQVFELRDKKCIPLHIKP